jgi:hypothetical protein
MQSKSLRVIHFLSDNKHDAEMAKKIQEIREEMERDEGEKVDFKKVTKRLINKGIKVYEGEK